MLEIIWPFILVIILLSIFLFLYNQGFMVYKSIRAISFIGSAKRNSANFTSCSGCIKRIIKFKNNITYTFTLDAKLSKGDISIQFLDSNKQTIKQLTISNPSESITFEANKKYYLVVNFKSATGSYTLSKQ